MINNIKLSMNKIWIVILLLLCCSAPFAVNSYIHKKTVSAESEISQTVEKTDSEQPLKSENNLNNQPQQLEASLFYNNADENNLPAIKNAETITYLKLPTFLNYYEQYRDEIECIVFDNTVPTLSDQYALKTDLVNVGTTEDSCSVDNATNTTSSAIVMYYVDYSLWNSQNGTYHASKILFVSSNYPIYLPPNSSYAFSSIYPSTNAAENTIKIYFNNINTSKVTNMSYMFSESALNTEFGALNLSAFDTSNVTNMSYMFNEASFPRGITFGDNFKGTKVTNVANMFYNTEIDQIIISNFGATTLSSAYNMFNNSQAQSISINLGSDESLTNVSAMFQNSAAEYINVKGLVLTNVTNFSKMFSGCLSLKEISMGGGNGTTSSYGMNSATSYDNMFPGTATLQKIGTTPFDPKSVPIQSGWYTSSLSGPYSTLSSSIQGTTIYRGYTITYNANGGSGAPSSQITLYELGATLSSTVPTRSGYNFLGWATNSTATAPEYFAGSHFGIAANTTLYAVWGEPPAEAHLHYNWKTLIGNVLGTSTLASIKSIAFYSSSDTGYTGTFLCNIGSAVSNSTSSTAVTASVMAYQPANGYLMIYSNSLICAPQNSSYLFGNPSSPTFSACTSLNAKNLSFKYATNTDYAISGFGSTLTSVDLSRSGFNTTTSYMFHNLTALTTITGMANWDMTKVASANYMFYGCSALTNLTDCENWSMPSLQYAQYMFANLSGNHQTSLDLSGWGCDGSLYNISYMFSSWVTLQEVNLGGNFLPGTYTSTGYMDIRSLFGGCYVLKTVNMSNWDFTRVSTSNDHSTVFASCYALSKIITPVNATQTVSLGGYKSFYNEDTKEGPYTNMPDVDSSVTLIASYTVTLRTGLGSSSATGDHFSVGPAFTDESLPSVTPPSYTGYNFDGYYSDGSYDTGDVWSESENSSITNYGIIRIYTATPSAYTESGFNNDLIICKFRSNFIPSKIEWCDLQDITSCFVYNTTDYSGYYYFYGAFYYSTFQTNGDTNRWIDLCTSDTSAVVSSVSLSRACIQYYNASGANVKNYDKTSNTTLYAKWSIKNYTVTYNVNTTDVNTYSKTLNTLTVDYRSTGFVPNWDTNFTISTQFKISAQGNRYLLFGNYNTTKHFNVEVTDQNYLRVYINNAGVDKTITDSTIPANTLVYLVFKWTASSNLWEVYASGTNVNVAETGTYDISGSCVNALRMGYDYRSDATSKFYTTLYISDLIVSEGGANANVYPNGNVTYGKTYNNLLTIERTGYTFNGWYTAASGGTKVTTSTTYSTDANPTLYAQWSANTFTIAFNGNTNTSGSTASVTATYGSTRTLTANGFAKTGYSFTGWATSSTGAVVYANQATLTADQVKNIYNSGTGNGGTYTLYAVWAANDATFSSSWRSTITNYASITEIIFSKTSSDYSGYTLQTYNVGDNISVYTNGTKIVFYCAGTIYASSSCSQLFYNCTALTKIQFNNFNTSNVTRMNDMFRNCSGLTELDLSNFVTTSVTDMSYMFYSCKELTKLDLSNFNTKIVTNMAAMFSGCSKLSELNISNFDTSSVTGSTVANYSGMAYMFEKCSALTSLTLSSFNTSKVINMRGMFSGCSGLTSLDLSNFNTSSVQTMSSMFSGCSGLTSLDLSDFDTSSVQNMYAMFSGCSGLTSLDVSSFNTSSVASPSNTQTGMIQMFSGCSGLTSLDLSSFNTSNIKSTENMFSGCSGLTSLDLSSFNTSNIENMYAMFSGCSTLTSLNLSNFDTSSVTTMSHMFSNCIGLTSLDLSNFNTSNVTTTFFMFSGCSGLTSLNISSFDMTKVTSYNNMLNCSNLIRISIPKTNSLTMDLPGTNWYKSTDYTVVTTALPTTSNETYQIIRGYLVSYNGNGSTGGTVPSTQLKVHNETLTLSSDTPERTNYKFIGWGTSSTSTSVSYNPGATYSNNIDTTLYAVWESTDGDFSSSWKSTITNYASITEIIFSKTASDYSGYTLQTYDVGKNIAVYTNDTKIVFYCAGTIYAPNSCSSLFNGCTALTKIQFNNFNTSNVTRMNDMFRECSGLTELDLSNFVTTSVTSMSYMFYNCKALTELDLSNFNTSLVTNMDRMFYYCIELKKLDVSNFDTKIVTNMYGMFENCKALTELDVSSFNTESVTKISAMFRSCSGLTGLDLSNFNTNLVTDFTQMFFQCSSLTKLDISSFNTTSVTSMNGMFSGCSDLKELDVSNFVTTSVTNMNSMFNGCNSLTELNVSNFVTTAVTSMSNMFSGCSGLTELNVSNFVTTSVTNMSYMFQSCNLLTELDLSNFNTTSVTNMSYMFMSCNSLTELDVSSFDTSLVTNYSYFIYANNLVRLKVPSTNAITDIDLPGNNWYKSTDYTFVTTALPTTSNETYQIIRGYLVSYNGNGSTGGTVPSTQLKVHNESLTLSSDTPEKTGSTFKGWGTSSTTTSVSYNAGATYSSNSATTLYALWSINSFTIAFNGNGSTSGSTASVTATYGSTKTLTANGFAKTGYSFTGWATSASGAVVYADKATLTADQVNAIYNTSGVGKDGTYTLYAVWEIADGYFSTSWKSAITNHASITEIKFSKTASDYSGYTLQTYDVGENISVYTNGTKIVFYCLGTIYAPGSCTQLFSYCTALTKIQFNNFNTSNVTSMGSMFQSSKALTELDLSSFDTSKVTSMGFMFSSCNSLTELDLSSFDTSLVTNYSSFISANNLVRLKVPSTNAITNIDLPGTNWYKSTDYTVVTTALPTTSNETYEIIRGYFVSYNGNGSTGGIVPSNQFKVHNEALTLSSDTPERTYYTFKGWGTSSTSTSVSYNPGATYSSNSTTTLYAVWSINSFTIAFNGNGSTSGSTASVTATYGSTKTLTANGFVKTGYSFSGWATSSTGAVVYANQATLTADQVNAMYNTSGVGKDGTYTLYAVWEIADGYFSSSWRSKITNYASITEIIFSKTASDYSGYTLQTYDVGENISVYTNGTKIVFYCLGTIYAKSCSSLFSGCTALTKIQFNNFNTSKVTSMSYMFYQCKVLAELDLSNFNTASVTNMSYMFYESSVLTELDLSNFNTASVTNMSYMFGGCSGLTELNVSNFVTTSVTTMSSMFSNCSGLTELNVSNFVTTSVTNMSYMFQSCNLLTELDISNFNTASVTNMSYMFYQCKVLAELDVSNFNTASVTNMSYMFGGCSGLTELNVSNFVTTSVTNMSSMFGGCSALTDLDISSFNTTLVTSYSSFISANNLVRLKVPSTNALEIDLPGDNWYKSTDYTFVTTALPTTSNQTYQIIRGYLVSYNGNGSTGGTVPNTQLKVYNEALTLSSDTPEKTNYVFIGWGTSSTSTSVSYNPGATYSSNSARTLYAVWESIDGYFSSSWKSAITNYASITEIIFSKTASDYSGYTLQTYDVGKNISVYTNGTKIVFYCVGTIYAPNFCVSLFRECSALTKIQFNNFNTSNVTEMGSMFQSSSKLTELDLTGFDTSKVTSMSYMFMSCSGLTELDLSNFVTTSVTSMSYMFSSCNSLTELDVSNFNTSSVTNMSFMFNGCSGLTELDVSNFVTTSVTNMSYMFSSCNSLTELDLSSFDTSLVTNYSSFISANNLVRLKVPSTNAITDIDLPGTNWYKSTDYTFVTKVLPTTSKETYQIIRGYLVSYNGNGSTGGTVPSTQLKVCNESLTLSSDTPEKTGSTFKGWGTSSTSTSVSYNPGATYSSNSATTLYAVWSANSFTIAFNGNGSTSGSTASVTATYGATKTLTANGFVKTGYSFSGWATSATGAVVYANQATLTVAQVNAIYNTSGVGKDGIYTLYAVWSANSFTIAFNGNGSTSGSTESLTATYGSTKTLTANGFVKTGYSFTGWATSSTGAVVYANQATLTADQLNAIYNTSGVGKDGTYTLYAVWEIADGYFSSLWKNIITNYASITEIIFSKTASDYSGYTLQTYNVGDNISVYTNGTKIVFYCLGTIYAPSSCKNLFDGCNALTKIQFNNFDTTSVTDMTRMFAFCQSLTELDVSNFVTSSVTNMSHMFSGCSGLTKLNVSNVNTASVKDMSYMFSGCSGLTELNISNFITTSVTKMTYMFSSCKSLTELDLSNFNTSSVTTMSGMFSNCQVLEELDLSTFNTASVITMATMFYECNALTELNIRNFNTASVTDMNSIFYGCKLLKEIDLSSFVTTSVTTMRSMFCGCSSLTQLDLSNFNTASVTDIAQMFFQCSALTDLDISSFNTSSVTDTINIFYAANNLVRLKVPSTNALEIDLPGTNWYKSTDYTVVTTALPTTSNETYQIIRGYLVSYNGNGSTGGIVPSTQLKVYNEALTLSSDTPERTYYTFKGWGTSSTSTSVSYNPGATYSSDIDATLYAVWSVNSFTIAFNGNTNTSGSTASVTATYGSTKTLTANGFVKTGYSFSGWATSSTGAVVYANQATLTADQVNAMYNTSGVGKDGTYTLYAVWEIADGYFSSSWKSTITNYASITEIIFSKTASDYSGYTLQTYDVGENISVYTNGTKIVFYCLGTIYAKSCSSLFSGCTALAKIQFNNFNTSKATSMSYMFYQCKVLADIDVSSFNTTLVTDMSYMFYNCKALTELDLSNFDTKIVTTMSYMFSNCSGLTELNVSNFVTTSVTNMSYMFQSCNLLTELDVSGFETTSVTDMSSMFNFCQELTALNVSGFVTTSVTSMSYMFYNCRALSELDVSNFVTTSVTNMRSMFSYCQKLTELDLSNFVTTSVTNMNGMFESSSALTKLNLSSFNTTSVTNMNYMFYFCSGLTELDVSNFNTSSVTNYSSMFSSANKLVRIKVPATNAITDIDLPGNNWYKSTDYTVVTTALPTTSNETYEIIRGYLVSYNGNGSTGGIVPSTQLKVYNEALTLSSSTPERTNYVFIGWGTSSTSTSVAYNPGATYSSNADSTLYAVWESTDGYFSTSWKSAITNYESITEIIFSKTASDYSGYTLQTYDVGKNISVYTNGTKIVFYCENTIYAPDSCTQLFSYCTALTKIQFNNFNTSNVTTMGSMFQSSKALTELDLSGFDTSKVTSMGFMFNGCTGLTELDLSSFNTTSLTSYSSMFSAAHNLVRVKVPSTNALVIDLPGDNWYKSTDYTVVTTALPTTSNETYEIIRGYLVSYNGNGNTGGTVPSTQLKVYNEALTLSSDTPEKTNYTFKGWGTSSTSTSVSYKPGATYSSNTDSTLYAVWSANSFTIAFNGNGSTSGSTASVTATYGSTKTLTANGFAKTGYSFSGWATSSTGAVVYANQATLTADQVNAMYNTSGVGKDGTYTLYAVWEINTFTITYNASGGSGAPASQTKTYGVDLTLQSGKPTYSGYAFLGWNTSSTAATAAYQPSGTYSLNEETTLYAIWANVSIGSNVTKTYGDAAFTQAATVKVGSTEIISSTSGWKSLAYSSSDTTVATVDTAGKVTIVAAGTATITATFTTTNGATDTGTYTLTVNAREITVTSENASKVYDGSALTKQSASITSTVKLATGDTITYTSFASITNVGSVENTFTVTIKNSASQDVTSSYDVTYKYGTLTVTIATLEKPASLKWSTENRGTATWAAVSGIGAVTVTYSVQLYKGSSEIGSAVSVTSGTTYNFANAIRTEGAGTYTFKVTAISSNQTNCANSAVSNASNNLQAVLLTAKTRTGIASAKVASSTSYVAINGESGIAIEATAKTGYNFASWTVDSGITVAAQNASTTITLSESTTATGLTITATAIAIEYTITYELNGGNVTGNPSKYTIETETFTLINPTKENYTFLGWTGSNGTTPQVNVSIEKGTTGNKEFTANWKANVMLTASFDNTVESDAKINVVVYTNGATYVTTLTNGATKTISAPINGTYTVKYTVNFNHATTVTSSTFTVTDSSAPQTISFNLSKTSDRYFFKVLNSADNTEVSGQLAVIAKEITSSNLAKVITIILSVIILGCVYLKTRKKKIYA